MQYVRVTLIGTSHCHLCDAAAKIVEGASQTFDPNDLFISISEVDIINHCEFYESFALQIPVVLIQKNNTEQFIYWPFTEHDVIDLIKIL